MYTYDIARDEDGNVNISVLVDGRMFHADQNHPNYEDIRSALMANSFADDQEVIDLFDVSFTIGQMFERLSDRVLVSGGTIFFDGEEIHSTLTDTILQFRTQGIDFQPLVNFFEKIMLNLNPNPHSREHLYRWLQLHSYSITTEGDFLAYKGVTDNYKSISSGGAFVNGVWEVGQITNTPGSIVEMPRSQVEFDPANACSVGLHVATFGFARSFTAYRVVVVKVNPRDVVSVPTDSGDAKMRVCRYLVLEDVDGPKESIYDDMSDLADDGDEYDEYKDDGYGWDETPEDDDTAVDEAAVYRSSPGVSVTPDPDRTLAARLRRAFGRKQQQ